MLNKAALIGYTGFVGSTLLKQASFTSLYRSDNISNIDGESFDIVVCAGAPGVKWLANKNPAEDKDSIDKLIKHLKNVQCKTLVLISTVDVFSNPYDVDESSLVETNGLHPYGLHRYELEKFVQSHFENHLIVRLPGLVGPGLKKNVIYDFLNQNNLDAIDSQGSFQFYPMVNLWFDIQIALENNLKLIHLTSEPVQVGEIAKEAFNTDFKNEINSIPVKYNFKTEFSHLYSSQLAYQYSKKETLLAIRAYAQSEEKKI